MGIGMAQIQDALKRAKYEYEEAIVILHNNSRTAHLRTNNRPATYGQCFVGDQQTDQKETKVTFLELTFNDPQKVGDSAITNIGQRLLDQAQKQPNIFQDEFNDQIKAFYTHNGNDADISDEKYQDITEVSQQEIYKRLVRSGVQPIQQNLFSVDIRSLLGLGMWSKSQDNTIPEMIEKVNEEQNINLEAKRAYTLQTQTGVICTYTYEAPQEKKSFVAGIVIEPTDYQLTEEEKAYLMEQGKFLALHVIAARPLYISKHDIPASVIYSERDHYKREFLDRQQSPYRMEDFADMKLFEWFRDVCLEDQRYVIDRSYTIEQKVRQLSSDVNTKLKIAAFVRIKPGEGLVS